MTSVWRIASANLGTAEGAPARATGAACDIANRATTNPKQRADSFIATVYATLGPLSQFPKLIARLDVLGKNPFQPSQPRMGGVAQFPRGAAIGFAQHQAVLLDENRRKRCSLEQIILGRRGIFSPARTRIKR